MPCDLFYCLQKQTKYINSIDDLHNMVTKQLTNPTNSKKVNELSKVSLIHIYLRLSRVLLHRSEEFPRKTHFFMFYFQSKSNFLFFLRRGRPFRQQCIVRWFHTFFCRQLEFTINIFTQKFISEPWIDYHHIFVTVRKKGRIIVV